MKLIELSLIVFVFITIIFLSPVVYKNVCEHKISYFIDTLNHDIHYGQNYTITHFTLIKLKFYPNDYYYRLIDGSFQYLKEVQYDKSLKLNSYITYDTIELTHGHVNEYYYFYLSCGTIKYKVNIYEKSGIINVDKV